jgi:hypothetical protein
MKDWRDQDDNSPYGSDRSIRIEASILAALIAFVVLASVYSWLKP